MVAIFTGAGTGFARGSGAALGGAGLLGNAAQGRSGDQVYLNAANGNLIIDRQDEYLAGRGLDASVTRTFNSQGDYSDDNGDNWRLNDDRVIFDIVGANNVVGSSVKWRAGDGSIITYTYNGQAYVATDGAGAHDTITWDGSYWRRTDGDSRITETYGWRDNAWRMVEQRDTSGNALTYWHTGGKVARVATSNGELIEYEWSGNNLADVYVGYYDHQNGGAWRAQVRTRYSYDGYNRLLAVATDLTPEDNNTTDNNSYVTQYSYYGSSKLISSIDQTDGSRVTFAYDAAGRVTSIGQRVTDGVTRYTSLEYHAGYTLVTDAQGQVTRLDYGRGDEAAPIGQWGLGTVARAEVAGSTTSDAVLLTAQGGWPATYQNFDAHAGETASWGFTLQANGDTTSHTFGLYSTVEGWGGFGTARIISGPGQISLVPGFGNVWRVTGLSASQATRIEVTRTFTQDGLAGAYFYVGGHDLSTPGNTVLMSEPTLIRSKDAVFAGSTDLTASWAVFNLERQQTGSLSGYPTYKYTVQQAGTWGATGKGWWPVASGQTLSAVISLRSTGFGDGHAIGIQGDQTGWSGVTTARIISGPGTVTAQGGFFSLNGLSTTEDTRIEIVRTFDRVEAAAFHFYPDWASGYRAGAGLIASAPIISRQLTGATTGGQLERITTTAPGPGATPQVTSFSYDTDGNLIAVTDPQGATSRSSYDANGNVLTSTDGLGNLTRRTYSATNQLLTETVTGSDKDGAANSHTTRYVYDSADRLRFVISPEGRVTENWTDGYGQVVWTLAYTGQFYGVGGLAENQVPTWADVYNWRASLADQTQISQTYFGYDARGNLGASLSFSGAVAAGVNDVSRGYSHQNYTYNQSGQLVRNWTSSQNAQSYVYDGLGRVIAVTDLAGGTTTTVFNDAATQTTVTLANGYTTVSTYAKTGELLSQSDSGSYTAGGTSTYLYDSLGRVRRETSAIGTRTYHLYDRLGRKTADIFGDGAIVEYRYDVNDRLVATVHYVYTIQSWSNLDNADIFIDVATLRPAAHPYDIWSWSVYDAEGRLVEGIEGDGSVAVFDYDASDRLVRTTRYANKLTPAQIAAFQSVAPSALVLPAAGANDAVARVFYDRDGNQIGALNGEGYLSRVVYDAGGRKVQEIAYANATNAAYRAGGSFQQLIDTTGVSSNDRITRYVYDGQNFLRYQIDAIGGVTEFIYQDETATWSAFGPLRAARQYATHIGELGSYDFETVRGAVNAIGRADLDRISRSVYDEAGRVAYTISAEGQVTGFTYDIVGNVIKQIGYADLLLPTSLPGKAAWDGWAASAAGNGNNRITRNYYNARGERRFSIDPEGAVSRYDYDADGQLVFTARWDQRVAADDGWTIGTVDANARGNWIGEWRWYDSHGRLYGIQDGEGTTHHYIYWNTGELQQDITNWTQADESRILYYYNNAGRVISRYDAVWTPAQALTQTVYDGLGNAVQTIDADGHATTRSFDKLGRVVSETNATGATTSYQYNVLGDLVKVTDARGNSTYNYYDRLGRVTISRDAEDYITETGYNEFGEISVVTRRFNRAYNAASTEFLPAYAGNSSDSSTSLFYDRVGRLRTTVDAAGYSETKWYDAFGNVIQAQNKLGGITQYYYDRRGQIRFEIVFADVYDGDGSYRGASYYRNIYEYDAYSNVSLRVQGHGLPEQTITHYSYDKANRLVDEWVDGITIIDRSSFASASTAPVHTSYKYDRRSNLIEKVDALGARTLFYYDQQNRKIAEIGALGALTTWSYDPVGNLTAQRAYAAPVALPATAGGTPPSAPGGDVRETLYTYDAINRLTASSITGVYTGYWANGLFYGGYGSVTSYYDYDALGNVVRATDGNGGQSYSYYDRAGRKIAQVDQEGYITRWTLDAGGNVLQERRYATKTSGASLAVQPWVPDSGDDRITNFGYDRNGRRVYEQRVGIAGWATNTSGSLYLNNSYSTIYYSYNGEGAVTRKVEATGDETNYTYDAQGRLQKETRAAYADGVRPTVRYYYDSMDHLVITRQGGESISSDDRITRYYYGAGSRLQSSFNANGQQISYWYDAVGNLTREDYARERSDSSVVNNYVLYQRDLLGRVTAQTTGTWQGYWVLSDVELTQYSSFGEVAAKGIGASLSDTNYQQRFQYDATGQLIRTNSGDGVIRFFVHDRNGNRTAIIESEGADFRGYSLDNAISNASGWGAFGLGNGFVDGITVTINRYDLRNQAIETILPQRELSEVSGRVTLTTRRSYNAFGEIAADYDARGALTRYYYNTMGRAVTIIRPTVLVTNEQGGTAWVDPTEQNYYDVSGRLIGTDDANGHRTTRALLAGSGYGNSEALTTAEYHADGGVVRSSYDKFGDLRVTTDEVGRSSLLYYDAMGRLIQKTKPNGYADFYAYDVLGQRIREWTNYYGAGEVQTTDYDNAGRVISTRAYGGDVTTTSYTYQGWLRATGLEAAAGGWQKITTYANGRTAYEYSDVFSHTIQTKDLGDHWTYFSYDQAGRQTFRTGGETVSINYLNTGQIGSINRTASVNGSENWWSRYYYDEAGHRTVEQSVYNGAYIQDARASYDQQGRLTSWQELGNAWAPAASVNWSYDAVGNVRHLTASHAYVDQNGQTNARGGQDFWYRYDAANRLVTAKGSLQNGQIVRGTYGTDFTYFADGRRATAVTNKTVEGQVWDPNANPGGGNYYPIEFLPEIPGGRGDFVTVYGLGDHRESFGYDANGNLAWVRAADSTIVDDYGSTGQLAFYVAAPSGSGAVISSYSYDGLDRQTGQTDYNALGQIAYQRSVTYDTANRVTYETTATREGTSGNVNTSSVTTSYGQGTAGYALGAALSTSTTNYRNGSYQSTSTTTTSYAWYGGAVQSRVSYTPSGQSAKTSVYSYNAQGVLRSVRIEDGRPRTITFDVDQGDQIVRRREADAVYTKGDPFELYYRFGGKQLGYSGNNGTLDVSDEASIKARTATPGTGAFRGGADSGGSYADFDQSGVEAINSYAQGSGGGVYSARAGDTLAGVALQLWGDASLWYKLAAANGLSASSSLTEGQALRLPSGVQRSSFTAATLNPYDPASAVGDTSPTAPSPAPKKNKCGFFGAILQVIIASVVTVLLSPLELIPVVGPVVHAAAVSAVSQGINVAVGLQDKFSWSAVGFAALTAGIELGGKELGVFKALGVNGQSGLAAGVRGLLVDAASQGVAVAVGLQPRFDWAGVVAAGVGDAVAHSKALRGIGGFKGRAVRLGASALAAATTRSLITGTDFGDNVVAVLPGVIGRIVGGEIGDALGTAVYGRSKGDEPAAAAPDPRPINVNDLKTIDPATLKLGSVGDIIAQGGSAPIDFEAVRRRIALKQEIVASLAAKFEASERSAERSGGYLPYGIKDGKTDKLPVVGGYFLTYSEIAARDAGIEAEFARGDYGLATHDAAKDALANNRSLLDRWNAEADAAVARLGYDFSIEAAKIGEFTGLPVISQASTAVLVASSNETPLEASLNLLPGMKQLHRIGEARLLASASERGGVTAGADLIASRPSILSDPSLGADELAYLQKAFARKELSIQRAANRGELVYSPGTDGIRIESLQKAYREAVAARFERRYGRPLDLGAFNADHPVDLIIGGSPEQSLRLLNQSVNKSVGASLLQATRRSQLNPGDYISSVTFK